ncbi:MFS general substrate transporter [Xylona heveae TC161]|uniref:MFS general substrate transporter n=1 Tax=Xylona heveae (strain CBS 132557 / TC161) TaxID=1328760 RepID=A0A165JGP8_XYLHT|nr:MFS general substrate transporter [Xylona heveae TC161]KZF26214.1 MFS general substrate transporter [Xylona heveae TC161]
MASGDEHVQDGVKRMESITAAWTIKALVITYLLVYMVSFINTLQQQITNNLSSYVTSSFQQHSLTATTQVLSGIIGGVSKLPMAKMVDIWGRVEGFALSVFLCTIGLVLMAACQNVETYAAAQVFYWVGYNNMDYVISIFLADTTSLTNRMIIYGLNSTPYIANTFAGPQIAQLFYEHSNFRWAFGAFSIITPVISMPLILSFVLGYRKAKRMGLVSPRGASGRTWLQSTWHYAREFDAVGMLLIIAGWALLLLPFSLASSQAEKWRTGSIIAMIILGGLFLIAFVAWEKFFAPVSFLPFKYLVDRTIMGACLLAGTLFVAFYCWDIYFYSYIQVVFQMNIRDSGYILNIYSIGSCFWAPIVGLLIRWSGRFKWLAIAAIPVETLGTALLIYFRHPGVNVGYIVMCQIFNAFAGGTLVMCMQIAVMAAVPHNEIAVVSALLGLFSSIGGAIGQSISGAIWTNLMPRELAKYLPADAQDQLADIYASLPVQLSYPWGSPIRHAIVQAYGEVMRKLMIAGSCFMPLAFISVLVWKNINVKNIEQTKGKVF